MMFVDLLIMRISILLKQCSSCLCSWDVVPRLWVTDPRRFETMYWFHLKKSSAQTLNLFCSACQSLYKRLDSSVPLEIYKDRRKVRTRTDHEGPESE